MPRTRPTAPSDGTRSPPKARFFKIRTPAAHGSAAAAILC